MLFYQILSTIAMPEWCVFLLYYLSAYVNVFRFPEKTTSKVVVVTVVGCIILIRSLYIVFFFLGFIDSSIVSIIQRASLYIIAAWWYIILFMPPIFASIYMIRTRGKGIGNIKNQGTHNQKVICILPVYNEEVHLLGVGLHSLLTCDFPKESLEVHLAFDDDRFSDLYMRVLREFKFPISVDMPESMEIITEYNVTLVLHRFLHSGKKGTQEKVWRYIDNKYKDDDMTSTSILLMDSDNIIQSHALHNFCVYLEDNMDKIGVCGYMTCISEETKSIVSMIQDCEYISCEINRFFEIHLGTVNCLPGAFTMIRFNAFKEAVKDYFVEGETDACITHFHQKKLGEDRYLTHLIHLNFPRGCIGFCPTARCKTDPPDTLYKFIKQRRRWLLGSIANEAYMVTSPSLWKKFPLLLIYKLFQTAWRSTFIAQVLVASFGIVTTSSSSTLFKIIFAISVCVPMIWAWGTSIVFGCKLSHYKTILLWPIMLVFYSVTYFFIDTYALITWNKKLWGSRAVVVSNV